MSSLFSCPIGQHRGHLAGDALASVIGVYPSRVHPRLRGCEQNTSTECDWLIVIVDGYEHSTARVVHPASDGFGDVITPFERPGGESGDCVNVVVPRLAGFHLHARTLHRQMRPEIGLTFRNSLCLARCNQ
jgi:hypothetical protein